MQIDLAKCQAELEAMWLLNWRMAAHVAEDKLTGADSSAVKVFGTERIIEIYRLLLGVVGAAATSHRARRGRCCGAASRRPAARRRSTPSAAA